MNPPDAAPRAEPLPPDLAEGLSSAAGRLGIFRGRTIWRGTVASTNDAAGALAEAGADEGTLVIAGEQTAGRGRRGRTWASPAGAGLYVSAVLRPRPHEAPILTLAAGVALVEGIRAATGLAAQLKWPNDLLAGGRKLAGILAEAGGAHVVLGFGINVRAAAYPPDVAARAASIEEELGRAVDRGAVLAECLAAMASRYDDVQRGNANAVLDAWRACAQPLLGRRVEWEGGRRGVAEGVDGSGALLVRTDAGTIRVVSGDVRWI